MSDPNIIIYCPIIYPSVIMGELYVFVLFMGILAAQNAFPFNYILVVFV